MKPAEQLRLVKAHARERLRAEEKRGGRGYQARLAEKLGCSSAHVSNMINHDSGPGEKLLEALYNYWGTTADAFAAEALGRPVAPPRQVHITPRNVVRDALEVRAKSRGDAEDVLDVAMWACAKAGATSLTTEEADALLDLAVGFSRGAHLVLMRPKRKP